MAAVSLFWGTNMAAVTSCENTLYADDLMMRYSTDNKLAPQAISDGLQSGWDRLHKGQITTK